MGESRFLLVEDHATAGRALKRVLGAHGKTTWVTSAREAEARLMSAECWSAAIVDVRLPDGSGVDVLRRTRAAGVFVPTLAVSGHVDGKLVNALGEIGVRCAGKPVPPAIVKQFILEVLEPHRRIEPALQAWKSSDGLCDAEVDVLRRTALGEDTSTIAVARGSSPSTVKKHSANLLRRLPDRCLDAAAGRLLRDALRRSR
jgi:DNA-binding NarL/FixJ family response regulator